MGIHPNDLKHGHVKATKKNSHEAMAILMKMGVQHTHFFSLQSGTIKLGIATADEINQNSLCGIRLVVIRNAQNVEGDTRMSRKQSMLIVFWMNYNKKNHNEFQPQCHSNTMQTSRFPDKMILPVGF